MFASNGDTKGFGNGIVIGIVLGLWIGGGGREEVVLIF